MTHLTSLPQQSPRSAESARPPPRPVSIHSCMVKTRNNMPRLKHRMTLTPALRCGCPMRGTTWGQEGRTRMLRVGMEAMESPLLEQEQELPLTALGSTRTKVVHRSPPRAKVTVVQ